MGKGDQPGPGDVGRVEIEPTAARYDERAPYRGLKVGVHSYSLRNFSLDEALAITRDLGLRYFSLNPKHLPLTTAPKQIAEARNKIADAGLILVGMGVVNMENDEKACRAVFDYARLLGVKLILCNPAFDCFDLLDTLVVQYDIRLAIHNHGPEGLYQTPDDILRAVKGHDPRIGACVDIGHYERSDVRAGDALRALDGRIFDVHIKDVDAREAVGGPVVVGTGVIDFDDVFKTLLAMNFPGHVALEYEADPDDPMPGMEKSLEFARAVLARL